VAQLLEAVWHCATNRKVVGSVPVGVDSAANRNENQGCLLDKKVSSA
jgi:hypothetical protein